MSFTLTVGLLCCGLDVCSVALSGISNLTQKIEFAVEVDPALHESLVGRIPNKAMFTGPKHGDLLARAVETWSIVSCILTGPPCQPFSENGVKKGFDDERFEVLKRVLEIIKYQSTRGLKFLIIENVRGFGQKPKTSNESVLGWVLYACPIHIRTGWVSWRCGHRP